MMDTDYHLPIHNVCADVSLNAPITSDLVLNNELCLIGIDEAGRGPVLGAMVYAVAYAPLSITNQLKKMDFADSKTLTEEKREEIYNKIGKHSYEHIGWFAKILSPNTISNSMFKRSKYNLNALSHDTAIALINRTIESGINVKEVYVDTVGPADKYEAKLKNIFPSLKIKVSNKADSIYPIVSAASICAKVIRDRALKQWTFIEKHININSEQFGSGYPSDPKTKEFLSNNIDPIFGFTTIVRFSWSTVTRILDNNSIECEWEESDDESMPEHNASILNFFKPKNDEKGLNKRKLSTFFTDRNLTKIKKLSAL